jgi:hypothetical protein
VLAVDPPLAGEASTSFGIRIPDSEQARRPRAAYCEFELSPEAGPAFVFWTGMNRTTFGLAFFSAAALKSRAPLTGRWRPPSP